MATYAPVDSLRFQWFWRQKKRRQRQGVAAPPTIVSQTLLADGVTLRLVFDQALTAGSAVGLTRSVGTITSASVVGGNLDIVVPKAYAGDSLGTLTYDGTGTLAGDTGAVAAFGPVAITNNSEQVAPVACAYPLDDDGTLAGAFGYAYAGPAIGVDSQTMDYTLTGDNQIAVLVPANIFSTSRFSRPASGYAVSEANITTCTGSVNGVLLLVISDAGGSFVNAANIVSNPASTDLLAVTVASDGTVIGYVNGSPISIAWQNNLGQLTVGLTDKFSLGLSTGNNGMTGDQVVVTLRTKASDITGSYGAGGKDVCGNAL